MQGKYDQSPIHNLYIWLNMALTNKLIAVGNIDDVLKLILINNGCKFDLDNENAHQNELCIIRDIIDNEYQICFVTGCLGNDANEFYDFIVFNGMKMLVVFLDYFNNISYGTYNSQDPLVQLKISMGNSIYYDAIKKIIEVFYLTSEPMPGGLLTTAMATTQRWNQAIIAIRILNEFKPIDENDVSDIPMDDVKKILDGNINMQLYGIRTM